MVVRFIYVWIFISVLCSCKTQKISEEKPQPIITDGKIEVNIIQLNDVYEIDALEGGKVGGLARVSTIIRKERSKNPNTLVVMAGDFLNPSLIGTLKEDGERIKGKQMIEVMNAIGVDLVVFGNHEFDLNYEDLQKRINESNFEWLGTSVRQPDEKYNSPFYKYSTDKNTICPDEFIWELKDVDGDLGTIGFFGATINSNPVDYVNYLDWYKTSASSINKLREKNSNYIIGLTHLDETDDIKLAEKVKGINLILGGHDHTNMALNSEGVWIYKADANAKTIYKHTLVIDTKEGYHSRQSQLIKIDTLIPSDPEVQVIVDKWNQIMNNSLKQIIDDPYELVYHSNIPLDAREHSIRYHQTNFGKIVGDAMMAASKKKADCAVFNGGSVRLDDQLNGDIFAIDIFRSLPYGGSTPEIEVKGSLLIKLLNTGEDMSGNGSYLQRSSNLRREPSNNKWYINGREIRSTQTYTVLVTDYLLKGLDIDFLIRDHPDIVKIDDPVKTDTKDLRNDIRKVIINYLKLK